MREKTNESTQRRPLSLRLRLSKTQPNLVEMDPCVDDLLTPVRAELFSVTIFVTR